MSTQHDITNKRQPATKGADCRIESENQTAHALACDYTVQVHHHNERAKAWQKQPEPLAEQVPDSSEPDYESEGIIPHN